MNKETLVDLLSHDAWFVEYANKKGEIKTRVLTRKNVSFEPKSDRVTPESQNVVRAYDVNNGRWVSILVDKVIAVSDYQMV